MLTPTLGPGPHTLALPEPDCARPPSPRRHVCGGGRRGRRARLSARLSARLASRRPGCLAAILTGACFKAQQLERTHVARERRAVLLRLEEVRR